MRCASSRTRASRRRRKRRSPCHSFPCRKVPRSICGSLERADTPAPSAASGRAGGPCCGRATRWRCGARWRGRARPRWRPRGRSPCRPQRQTPGRFTGDAPERLHTEPQQEPMPIFHQRVDGVARIGPGPRAPLRHVATIRIGRPTMRSVRPLLPAKVHNAIARIVGARIVGARRHGRIVRPQPTFVLTRIERHFDGHEALEAGVRPHQRPIGTHVPTHEP